MRKKIFIASLAIIFLFGIIAVKAQDVSTIVDRIVKEVSLMIYNDIKSIKIEPAIIPNDIEEQFGASFMGNIFTLVGSSDDCDLLPEWYVEANSTTTVALDNGGLLQQRITTAGLDNIYLAVKAVGAVSTSTMYIKPLVSWDGTNYYNIATSTPVMTGTTTANVINSYIRSYTPGTATSSIKISFPEIKGADYVRFIIYGEKDGDLNLGIQAYIQAIKEEGISR